MKEQAEMARRSCRTARTWSTMWGCSGLWRSCVHARGSSSEQILHGAERPCFLERCRITCDVDRVAWERLAENITSVEEEAPTLVECLRLGPRLERGAGDVKDEQSAGGGPQALGAFHSARRMGRDALLLSSLCISKALLMCGSRRILIPSATPIAMSRMPTPIAMCT